MVLIAADEALGAAFAHHAGAGRRSDYVATAITRRNQSQLSVDRTGQRLLLLLARARTAVSMITVLQNRIRSTRVPINQHTESTQQTKW